MPYDADVYVALRRELLTRLGMPEICPFRQCRRARRCAGPSGRYRLRNRIRCIRDLPPALRAVYDDLEPWLELHVAPSRIDWTRLTRTGRNRVRFILSVRNRVLLRHLADRHGPDSRRAARDDPDHPLARLLRALELPPDTPLLR